MAQLADEVLIATLNAVETCGSYRKVADHLGIHPTTVADRVKTARYRGLTATSKPDAHAALPAPAPEAGGPDLPTPSVCDYGPFDAQLEGPGTILSDVHIPYHCLNTLQKWVEDSRRLNVAWILLNGDILDCYQVSDHYKEPNKARMKEEIDKGRQFLEYLRATFPRARIIYKAGNHDDRLKRYLATRAPELFDLEDLRLDRLLRLKDCGVEWVEDKRVVMVGKLPVIHGHEYVGGGGVMPARWYYLRTGGSVLGGHFHQPSHYSFKNIKQEEVGCWSTGCGCHMQPAFRPLNQWANGWATVEVGQGGSFHVDNKRLLLNGRLV